MNEATSQPSADERDQRISALEDAIARAVETLEGPGRRCDLHLQRIAVADLLRAAAGTERHYCDDCGYDFAAADMAGEDKAICNGCDLASHLAEDARRGA